MMSRCQNVIEPDKGWSWVVAFASWMVNLCTNGLLRSQGVLFVAVMDSFGVNRQTASWPFSLCIATACFSGLLSGVLLQLLSVRQVLFVTASLVSLGYALCSFAANDTLAITIFYGVVAGVGNGFVTPSLAVATNLYFKNHRATANGISLSGIACGALVFPFLTTRLMNSYGLRGAFLVLGGVALNVFAGASLLRPGRLAEPEETDGHPVTDDCTDELRKHATKAEGYQPVCTDAHELGCDQEHSSAQFTKTVEIREVSLKREDTLSRVWILFVTTFRDPLYHLVSLSALSSILVLLIFVMIIVDHAVDAGVSPSRAPLLLSYFSVPDLLGRLGSGWLSDRGFVRRKTLFATTKALSGLVMLVLPWLQGEVYLSVATALLGLLEGVATILTNVLFVDYLGLERVATALSLWSFSIGVVFLATPSLIGLFRDLYGHYDSMFYLMSAVSLVTAFSWTFEPWLIKGTRTVQNKKCNSEKCAEK